MNDVRTLRIAYPTIASDGSGIARTERGVIFVRGALPGELVRAKIIARMKDFAIADTIEVLVASGERSEPQCKHYGRCGGCQLSHCTYSYQLELKEEIVKDAMTRLGGFSREQLRYIQCRASRDYWGYRNKAAFPVQSLNGRIVTGFYRAGTHRLEFIRSCPVNAKFLTASKRIITPLTVTTSRLTRGNCATLSQGLESTRGSRSCRSSSTGNFQQKALRL